MKMGRSAAFHASLISPGRSNSIDICVTDSNWAPIGDNRARQVTFGVPFATMADAQRNFRLLWCKLQKSSPISRVCSSKASTKGRPRIFDDATPVISRKAALQCTKVNGASAMTMILLNKIRQRC